MPNRLRACGTVAVGERPVIVLDTAGGAHLRGIASCGSVWLCPVCEQKIQAARRRELETAVEGHGRRACLMISLTMRHGRGQSLRDLRSKLAKAYTAMTRGKPWQRFAERFGIVGSIRALEVTHGAQNGWHPHLHVIWLCHPGWLDMSSATVDGESLMPTDDDRGFVLDGERATGQLWHDWLVSRWRTMVARHVGPDHEPDDVHGLQVTPCDRGGSYLAKLGLEIAPPGTKPGRWGHRSPWQIATALIDHPNGYDLGLWSEYCGAMHHARRLSWSRGLKARFGLLDQTDEEAAADIPKDAETVCVIDAEAWKEIRGYNLDGKLPTHLASDDDDDTGVPAVALLLEAAEKGSRKRVFAVLEFLTRAAQAARRTKEL